jgi:hypothetical protein
MYYGYSVVESPLPICRMMMAKILDVRASDDRAYKDYWWNIQRVNEGTRNAKVILFYFCIRLSNILFYFKMSSASSTHS